MVEFARSGYFFPPQITLYMALRGYKLSWPLQKTLLPADSCLGDQKGRMSQGDCRERVPSCQTLIRQFPESWSVNQQVRTRGLWARKEWLQQLPRQPPAVSVTEQCGSVLGVFTFCAFLDGRKILFKLGWAGGIFNSNCDLVIFYQYCGYKASL